MLLEVMLLHIAFAMDWICTIILLFDFTERKRITNGQASLASPIAGKLFVLVGAGGAGRAIAFGAKSRGARVVIFNRNFGKLFSLNGHLYPFTLCFHIYLITDILFGREGKVSCFSSFW